MQILGIAVAVGLISLNVFACLALSESQDRAAQAAQDARLCRQLADRIERLRTRPAIAGSKEQAQEALSQRIEAAARACNINGDNLATIAPEAAARLADTAYLEKPTSVQLRAVSLAQLIDFLCTLSSDESGLRVKALRLTAPHAREDDNRWSVELTVVYLIYAPAPRESSKGDI
jgi:hypothetical protein